MSRCPRSRPASSSAWLAVSKAQGRRRLPREVPRHPGGDETRLEQVLANLVSNVLKYAPEGEPHHRYAPAGHVCVSDQGPGIDRRTCRTSSTASIAPPTPSSRPRAQDSACTWHAPSSKPTAVASGPTPPRQGHADCFTLPRAERCAEPSGPQRPITNGKM